MLGWAGCTLLCSLYCERKRILHAPAAQPPTAANRRELQGHTANILGAAFLPASRGDQLLTCSADRQIRHLNVTKGAVRPYLVHAGRVRAVVPLDPRASSLHAFARCCSVVCTFTLCCARGCWVVGTDGVVCQRLRHARRPGWNLRQCLYHTADPSAVFRPPTPPTADLFLSASEDGTVREFDVRQRPAAVHREALAGDGSNVLGEWLIAACWVSGWWLGGLLLWLAGWMGVMCGRQQ